MFISACRVLWIIQITNATITGISSRLKVQFQAAANPTSFPGSQNGTSGGTT